VSCVKCKINDNDNVCLYDNHAIGQYKQSLVLLHSGYAETIGKINDYLKADRGM